MLDINRRQMISASLAMMAMPPCRGAAAEPFIRVEENETVFAVFALMNAAGYDIENYPRIDNPVRRKVRAALAAALPPSLRDDIRRYYREHFFSPVNRVYGTAALAMGAPPDFAFEPGWRDVMATPPFANLRDLPTLLGEFWRVARLADIYADVRPDYLNAVALGGAVAAREIAAVLAFCRAESDMKSAVIFPNLMESHDRAFSVVRDGTFVSVEGPLKSAGYSPHEFVHSILRPVSGNPAWRNLQMRAAPVFATVRTMPKIGGLYPDTPTYLDENLVRAVTLKYRDTGKGALSAALRAQMTAEYRDGFVIEKFFYDRLEAYKRGTQTLAEFYPVMLAEFDAEKELAEWRAR
jgi:hypothetical protein